MFALKGGFAMELRLLSRARATKDVDLACTMRLNGSEEDTVLEQLRKLASRNLNDYFEFEIGPGKQELAGHSMVGRAIS